MMQTAIDKLRELRALHEDGLLSRQEFDSRKNAILDAAYPADAPADAGVPTRAGTEIGLMATQEVGPAHRRYRLDRLIAQGGMGEVWQATDLATQAELGHSAQVALKILPPSLTENALHAKLLVEEAARARQLAHQHIVRVYDWAQDPATGSYFIIMECLEGEDLDTLLAREGTVGLERALDILDPVAAALDHAWERHGLVHRDIKPANVFLARGGDVKLLDFGIAARARADGDGPALEAPASSGTAGYRAPEARATGAAPGRTLDVFAVAVMLFRMLAGALPAGADPRQPAALNDAQWAVLRAGFARDREARPASVTALLARLRAAQGPSEDELRARAEGARRAEEEALRERAEQAARDVAARKLAEARAVAEAAARTQLERQRREQERAAKAATEAARAARKEALRQQLLERRAAEAEKARLEQEEAQRKLAQAKAAAAYIAEQKRARAEEAVRAQAVLAQLLPTPASPVADTEGVLRDRFLDGDKAGAEAKGPELVLLPTGRFQMGSPEHERQVAMAAGSQPGWLARELPQHWVGIVKPVAMGRYPVTVGEWRAFVRATGWRPSGEVDWDAPGFAQTDHHPVVGVNWFDALHYVRWLSEATGKSYRLPSEAEWEYACRAGTKTAFSCGDTITTDQANFDGNFTYNGAPRGVYRRGTTPVGSFPANPWGLFDMHGNVWEWVQDVVHDNYEGAPLDGSAWEEGGDQARRVLRGGSWLYNPRYLRSALRNGFSAVLSNDIVGFRVVRDLM
jgi:formylglycine-generating enzyme required for sulfatase activity